MPYNLDLERRLDGLAAQLGTYTKKKMFGGVGYMMKGNMVFGIHKQSLLIRTSVEQAERLLEKDSVSPFDMTGRPMKGWVLVSREGIATDKQLLEFLNLAISYIKSLPAK